MSPNKSKRGTDDSVSPEERKSKRKKTSDENEEEEEKEGPGSNSKMKIPAYLSSSSQKPAELFRKDLISAMKLADSESLAPEEYLLISDSWRQEWERGVQVPVNEDGLQEVELREVHEVDKSTGDFKMPKKLLHASKDETYRQGCHELTGMSQLAEQVVRYDLDDLDVRWLQRVNEEREEMGEIMIHEWTVERVIEALETKCHENMEIKKKTEEGLGIEYDEDIVCEICRSPDSEDSNEMVFCDGCDICVHQACYGIATVPEGSWLCRTCALGIKPACILCPKTGGAMKSTRSGTKWAHVSCAIWIPEVTIGCVEKMEPITKISEIPASRWSLVCTICKERVGACIQCSVKACKTAFHVTCGFASNLEMKTILIEEADDDEAVKLKAYCPKHSKKRERNTSDSEPDSPRKSVCGTPKKEMSDEEKAKIRAERLQRLEEEFYTVISVHELASSLELDQGIVDLIFVYWKLKRKSLFDRPLLTPKTEEADLLEKQQEDSLVARMKMFVHLRQDLERVRNLSYMISRREKMKRSFNKCRENVFYATLAMLTDESLKLTEKDIQDVVRQYRDIPGKDSSSQKSGKTVRQKSFLSDFESASDSGFRPTGTGLTSKNKKKLAYDSDSDATSVTSAVSSISPETAGIKGKRIRKFSRKSDSVCSKLKGRSSSSNVDKSGDQIDIKTADEKMEVDVTDSDLNNSAFMDVSVTESTNADTCTSNLADMDTSDIIDVVKMDDTLVKSDTDTSSQDNTLVKSELDTSVGSTADDKDLATKKTKKVAEEKRTQGRRGRPPKRKIGLNVENKNALESESNSKVTLTEKLGNEKSELPNKVPLRTRSTRSEKSSIDEKEIEEKVSVTEKPNHKSGSKLKSSHKQGIKEKTLEKDEDSKTEIKVKEEINKTSPSSKTSPSRSLFESMEKELIEALPSAKNVPKEIKAELCGYFRNNKLVVSDIIKQKVQSSLLNCRRNRHFANGIHISAQKSLDSLFNASRSDYETNSQNGSDKTVSRVLNELSPTRDRLESNNLLMKKSDCDRISDRIRTRSSRDTSPDSQHGSDISTGSLRRSGRTLKRSNSRSSVDKDHQADLIDVENENIWDSSVKRKTRSMDIDDKKLKERSLSPTSLLQKNTPKIIS